MHSLLPSPAEITTGSLWRARLHSPPSLLTNTFRHSHRAKHSRSCLGQLLQLPKILSQRAPTTIMPTFNCGGSVNHLLSSCLLSQVSPSPHLCRDCPGHWWWWHPKHSPKNQYTTCIPHWPVPSVLQILLLVLVWGVQVPSHPSTAKLWAYRCKPSITAVRAVLHLHWHFK